jgi:hypothetical protein
LEPATHGVGKWLVGRGEDRVDVIAAPGVPIPSAERDNPWCSNPQLVGWRHASWKRSFERRLNLDRDAPDSDLCTISTCEVLDTIDIRLCDSVRKIMTDQLAHLQTMDSLPALTPDPEFEREARLAISAIAWVQTELVEAFPEHFPHLRNPTALVSTSRSAPSGLAFSAFDPTFGNDELHIPETAEALQAQIRPHVYSKGLGGRELWRLLKRRAGWRVMEKLPRTILVVLFACTHDGHELHDLVTRMLTEHAFQSDWPLVTHLNEVEGRIQRVLAIGWPEHHYKISHHGETINPRSWLRATIMIRRARRRSRSSEEEPAQRFDAHQLTAGQP